MKRRILRRMIVGLLILCGMRWIYTLLRPEQVGLDVPKHASDMSSRKDEKVTWRGHHRRAGSRAEHYSDCQGQGDFAAVATLILPRTLLSRTLFLIVILFSVSFPIPNPFKLITVIPAVILTTLVVLYFMMDGMGDWDDYLSALIAFGGIAVLVSALVILPFLVTNGQGISSAPMGKYASGELRWSWTVLAFMIVWLLVGIPNQAHRIRLAHGGISQQVLIRVLTFTACSLTAILFFLMHFSYGPLYTIPIGPLAAGIIFTVVLVTPFYRSLAEATWRHGIDKLASPERLKSRWRSVAREVRAGLDKEVEETTDQ
jgi:hypothetical protein